mgnify:CR=1 FL=1
MNYGLKRIDEVVLTKSKRPPQVKSSKAQIQAKYHKIPTIRFEDQLTKNGHTLKPTGNPNHGIRPTDSSLHGAKLENNAKAQYKWISLNREILFMTTKLS